MTNYPFGHVFATEPDILDHLIASNDEPHRNPESRREIHYPQAAFRQLKINKQIKYQSLNNIFFSRNAIT